MSDSELEIVWDLSFDIFRLDKFLIIQSFLTQPKPALHIDQTSLNNQLKVQYVCVFQVSSGKALTSRKLFWCSAHIQNDFSSHKCKEK